MDGEYVYTPPDFLKEESVDTIHSRMLKNLPNDIDKSENQIPWDFTRPAAIEIAERLGFGLNETIKIMFPQWAYGHFLDLHAETVGLRRKDASKAAGSVTVTGVLNTLIPKGFVFATAAGENFGSVLFEALHDAIIDNSGTAEILVQAIEGGISGNVNKDKIILVLKPLTGIKSVTNTEPLTGGSPIESDNALRIRILESLSSGISFVGNNSDYIRWAKEVVGVGYATVLPEWNGPGTVKLIISDMNGLPANQYILDDVYKYIYAPDEPMNRLAPIGAILTVAAPESITIDISAKVKLEPGAGLEGVISEFKNNLLQYYLSLRNDTTVKYIMIAAILAQTKGVWDFTELLINGLTDNVNLAVYQFPVTGEVVFVG